MSVGGIASVSLVTAVTFPSECQNPRLLEAWISPRVKDGGNKLIQADEHGGLD